jgi:hypothetical protein
MAEFGDHVLNSWDLVALVLALLLRDHHAFAMSQRRAFAMSQRRDQMDLLLAIHAVASAQSLAVDRDRVPRKLDTLLTGPPCELAVHLFGIH